MCKKQQDVQKNNKMYKKRERKTVYWDLINSNVNKRDVQTGCSGYCTQREYLQLTMGLVSVYEAEFEFRRLSLSLGA